MYDMNHLFSQYLVEQALEDRQDSARKYHHGRVVSGSWQSGLGLRAALRGRIERMRWRRTREISSVDVEAEGATS